MSLQFRRLVLFLACTTALCNLGFAQGSGSITARLVDPNGAVITNLQSVSVSMRNKMTSERAGAGDVSGPTPRTPDGKVDFGGFWSNLPTPPGGAPRLPPMQPWAAEMQQELQKVNTQNAGAYCLPQFVIPVAGGFPYKIVQSEDGRRSDRGRLSRA